MSRVRIASPALEKQKKLKKTAKENRKVEQESFRYTPKDGWKYLS